jgi:hypothetical protein
LGVSAALPGQTVSLRWWSVMKIKIFGRFPIFFVILSPV